MSMPDQEEGCFGRELSENRLPNLGTLSFSPLPKKNRRRDTIAPLCETKEIFTVLSTQGSERDLHLRTAFISRSNRAYDITHIAGSQVEHNSTRNNARCTQQRGEHSQGSRTNPTRVEVEQRTLAFVHRPPVL